MQRHSMVLLNELGHIEISWDADAAEKMHALIERKLSEGVRFFIVKPVIFGFGKRNSRIRSSNQIKDNKVLIDDGDLRRLKVEASQIDIKDPELAKLAADGTVAFTRRVDQRVETIRIAKSAQEVMTNTTVGVRAMQGG